MIEVEVKAAIKDIKSIKKSLKELGASFIESREEKDDYYQHPSRDFSKTDEALRMRRVGKQVLLTYKGPKLDKKSKTREEITLDITKQAKPTEFLMQRLGFNKAIEVFKQRELYRLEGFEICLDRVKGLGTYLEIEGKETKDFKRTRNKALSLLNKLGIKDTTRKSYVELLSEKI
jgi:adenylate cyclase class 2